MLVLNKPDNFIRSLKFTLPRLDHFEFVSLWAVLPLEIVYSSPENIYYVSDQSFNEKQLKEISRYLVFSAWKSKFPLVIRFKTRKRFLPKDRIIIGKFNLDQKENHIIEYLSKISSPYILFHDSYFEVPFFKFSDLF